MEPHDKDCELQGGFNGCKCWLRARGRHPVVAAADAWRLDQVIPVRARVQSIIDQLNEAAHEADREQEQVRERLR